MKKQFILNTLICLLCLNASASDLDAVFARLMDDPTNLDLNFEYANKAIELEDYDAAMATYERMLIVNPDLPRIKLDLAALHVSLGNFELAKELFTEVLEADPPQQVIANINALLEKIQEQQKKHFVSGALSLGLHTDSNANSASAAGEVTFQGIDIPLDDASKGQQDDARSFGLSISHRYMFHNQDGDQWKSQYNFYKTKQASLEELDLTFHSLSTGPVLNFPKSGVRISPKVGYNFIDLGKKPYQEAATLSIEVAKQLNKKTALSTTLGWENKHYFNSADSRTLSERNGDVFYALFDVKYAFTPKDLLSLSYKHQKEKARRAYYSYNQNMAAFSYTRMFTPSLFASVNFYIKATDYKNVDSFVDPSTIREETERGSQITVGKTFGKLSASMSYIWRDVNSNITNYTYDNERISANLGWRF